MKPKLKSSVKVLNVLSALLLLAMVSGCETIKDHSLTANLWRDQSSESHCHPPANPKLNLFVFPHPADVLVEYDAASDRDHSIRRRAYLLFANEGRLENGQPPRFVSTNLAAGLDPIPVYGPPGRPAPTSSTNAIFAVSHGNTFSMYCPNNGYEDYKLPDYPDNRATDNSVRVALTPFSVALDLTVAGAVIGIVGGVMCIEGICEGNTQLPAR